MSIAPTIEAIEGKGRDQFWQIRGLLMTSASQWLRVSRIGGSDLTLPDRDPGARLVH